MRPEVAWASENCHRAFPPDAVFFVFQRIDVKQDPAFCQQPVDFFSSSGLDIVSHEFRDIELPKRDGSGSCHIKEVRLGFFHGCIPV